MSVTSLTEIEFGTELPQTKPDTSLDNVRRFCAAAGWDGPRFTSHEAARELGFSGAIVPGVMSQGILGAVIHGWAPQARIDRIDTVFRAPVLVDHDNAVNAVVTDIDEDDGSVELDLTIVNDKGETRVFGTARIRFD